MITNSTAAGPKVNRLTQISVGAALVASTAMSGFGVGSAFWNGLQAGQPEAWIGLAIIGGALAASETGAIAVAWAITKDGLTFARAALFALTTAGNMLAGHYGAEAINTRLVAPQRAPYESAVSSASAMLELSRNTKTDLEARHARESADIEAAFENERAANPNYVTSRGRQQTEQRDAIAARQGAELRAVQADMASAAEQFSTAQARLTEAPMGFDPTQLWGFAVLMELLKGVLMWAAAPRQRRRPVAAGNVMPIDPAFYEELNEEEALSIENRASTAKALAQHRRRRIREAKQRAA